MKALISALVLVMAIPAHSVATGFEVIETAIEDIVPNAQKFDTKFLMIISQAESEGQDLNSIMVEGFMKLKGNLDEASAQTILGDSILVRSAIPGAWDTIITFESSLQSAIEAAQLEEVLVLQAPRRIFPQPAFSGHN